VTTGDVRVYLIGYTICIIDCHICQDIFDKINIMYYKLPYVYEGVLLPQDSYTLYIPVERHNAIHPKIINLGIRIGSLYYYTITNHSLAHSEIGSSR
jgi:hypothetical protein